LVGICLHNFPEGLAIAVGTVSESTFTLVIAAAIAIHNIPEGICTATPYYHITGKRLRSFLTSAATSIPIILGYLLGQRIYQNVSPQLIGLIIGATAGLMVYISADELIPTSSFKLTNHSTIFSLIAGVIFVILLGSI
jgi:ZIP family zinc transporter